MKINRNQLKAIIKECLVEILQEGIGSSTSFSSQPVVKSQVEKKIHTPVFSRPAHNPQKLVQESVSKKNSIPNLAAIMADTAQTTLQNIPSDVMSEHSMIQEEYSVSGGDAAGLLVSQKNPEELFGSEMVNLWSDLAFQK